MTFANIYFLTGLLLLPLLIFYYIRKYSQRHAPIRYSSLAGVRQLRSWKARFYPVLFVLRILAIALLIVALARPQTKNQKQDISIEGIDIIISLDISSSMLATDFNPNRLEAAKSVASDFIRDRKNDRLGLVIFSAESFTQSPLTTDHQMITNLFDDIQTGMLTDGTAIGEGLATAVQRLKDSEARSKVVILLTDGVNNRGSIDPLTAAEMADLYGIRVYTIGVGSNGKARMPVGINSMTGNYVFRQREVNIDEKTLKDIASISNGKYFRATNKQKLTEIYQAIDQLEKSKIDVLRYERKKEEFFTIALLAFLLILLEWGLRKTVFRTVP
ncbi:MAG: VWA domain-containing protein [Bacteroidales bacterium]